MVIYNQEMAIISCNSVILIAYAVQRGNPHAKNHTCYPHFLHDNTLALLALCYKISPEKFHLKYIKLGIVPPLQHSCMSKHSTIFVHHE